MLNLNGLLQVFVQVVDHGGFTAANRALDLPKQTLSKRVAELERRVGVRLIQISSYRSDSAAFWQLILPHEVLERISIWSNGPHS